MVKGGIYLLKTKYLELQLAICLFANPMSLLVGIPQHYSIGLLRVSGGDVGNNSVLFYLLMRCDIGKFFGFNYNIKVNIQEFHVVL